GPAAEAGSGTPLALAALGVHSAAMLATIAAVSLIVYHWTGADFLRRGWINLDLILVAVLATCGAGLLFAQRGEPDRLFPLLARPGASQASETWLARRIVSIRVDASGLAAFIPARSCRASARIAARARRHPALRRVRELREWTCPEPIAGTVCAESRTGFAP